MISLLFFSFSFSYRRFSLRCSGRGSRSIAILYHLIDALTEEVMISLLLIASFGFTLEERLQDFHSLLLEVIDIGLELILQTY